MLPRIDANGGRGTSRRDILQSRSGADAALAPLPRLRLLKQAGPWQPDQLPQQLPPLDAPPPVPHLGAPAELPPPRRLLRSRGESNERRPGSGGQHRRGRGLLRPLDPSGEARHEPRAPPVLPWASPGKLQTEDREVDSAAALQQQLARDRVKEQRRQLRRAAREEEERRHQDDQDRLDRVQRQAGQVEAHRRDLARQAAERQRRLHEDREAQTHEREELQSARRERVRRVAHQCQQQGGSTFEEGSPGVRGSQRRAGRAPNAEVQGSRDRERRQRHGGRSRGSAMDPRNNNGRAPDHPEPNTSTDVNAARSKDADAGDRTDAGSNTAPELGDVSHLAMSGIRSVCIKGDERLLEAMVHATEDFAADLPVRLATALDAALASGELVKTIDNVASGEEAAKAVQPPDESAGVAEAPGIGLQPFGHDAEATEASGSAAENTASNNAPDELPAATSKAAEAVQPSDEAAEVRETCGIGVQPFDQHAEAAEVSGTAAENTASDTSQEAPDEPPVGTTKGEGMDTSGGSPAEAPDEPRGEAAADSASADMEAAGAEALAEAGGTKPPGEADAYAVGTEAACAEAPAEAAGEGPPGEEAASAVATVTNEQV